MKATPRPHILPVIVLGAAVGLALVAWREGRDTRRVSDACDELAVKTRAIRADSTRVEQRIAEAERLAAARRNELAPANDAKTPVPPTQKAPAAAPPRSLSIEEIIREEPETETLYLASQRSRLAARYGPLFRALALSAVAAEKFQDAYMKHEATRMDLDDALRTQGAESAAAVMKLRAAAEEKYVAELRELLGEAGFQRWQDYNRTASVWAAVSAVAGAAAVEHASFTPAQAEALVQAIAGSCASFRAGYGVDLSQVDWAAVDAQARAILSPEQWEIFHTMDPGPSRGGLLQTKMYALVAKANAKEPKAVAPLPGAASPAAGR